MRARAIDRIFIILAVLFVIAAGLLMLAAAWKLVDEDFLHGWIFNFYAVRANSFILTTIAAVLLIMAFRLLYAATTPYKRAAKALVRRFESGSVSISLDTIGEIAKRHAQSIDGVKDVRCAVVPQEDGIRLLYKITVEQDAVIPEKTQAIQSQVKERVEALTGASVKESSVLVENPKPSVPRKNSNAGELA